MLSPNDKRLINSIVRLRLIEVASFKKCRLLKYTVDFTDKIEIFAKFEIHNLKEELEESLEDPKEDPKNIIFLESSEGFYKRDLN